MCVGEIVCLYFVNVIAVWKQFLYEVMVLYEVYFI